MLSFSFRLISNATHIILYVSHSYIIYIYLWKDNSFSFQCRAHDRAIPRTAWCITNGIALNKCYFSIWLCSSFSFIFHIELFGKVCANIFCLCGFFSFCFILPSALDKSLGHFERNAFYELICVCMCVYFFSSFR